MAIYNPNMTIIENIYDIMCRRSGRVAAMEANLTKNVINFNNNFRCRKLRNKPIWMVRVMEKQPFVVVPALKLGFLSFQEMSCISAAIGTRTRFVCLYIASFVFVCQ